MYKQKQAFISSSPLQIFNFIINLCASPRGFIDALMALVGYSRIGASLERAEIPGLSLVPVLSTEAL